MPYPHQFPSRGSYCHPISILLVLLVSMVLLSPAQHPHGLAEAHGGPLARHLLLQDLSMVVLVVDGQTTEGPFDEEVSDYVDDPDMTLAARAGAVEDNDVTVDRTSVLNGIPMNLTINVYGLANRTATVAHELSNIEVSIWHCDAAGVYSAAESEGTEGQKWLRGRQLTNANGTVTFRTILPGLYRGRMGHYHVRLRLPGESTYAATSQLYIADGDVDDYRTEDLYSTASGASDQTITYSTTDMVYSGVDPTIAQMLTLSLDGDVTTAVSSTISLALITDVGTSPTTTPNTTTTTTTTSAPVASPSVASSPSATMATTPSAPASGGMAAPSSSTSSSPPAIFQQPKVVVLPIIMMMTVLTMGAMSSLAL